MVVWRMMAPPFFQGITLPKRNHDLILETAEDEAAAVARFGLPDSGNMPTVVAPDLSNLPPGETAINPETGEEFTRASPTRICSVVTARSTRTSCLRPLNRLRWFACPQGASHFVRRCRMPPPTKYGLSLTCAPNQQVWCI